MRQRRSRFRCFHVHTAGKHNQIYPHIWPTSDFYDSGNSTPLLWFQNQSRLLSYLVLDCFLRNWWQCDQIEEYYLYSNLTANVCFFHINTETITEQNQTLLDFIHLDLSHLHSPGCSLSSGCKSIQVSRGLTTWLTDCQSHLTPAVPVHKTQSWTPPPISPKLAPVIPLWWATVWSLL